MEFRFLRSLCILFLVMGILTACAREGADGEQGVPPNPAISNANIQGGESKPDKPNVQREITWQADYSRLANRYELALAAEGSIYGYCVKDGQVLLERTDRDAFSASGAFSPPEVFSLPGISSLSGMAADSQGNLYLLENKEEGAKFWKMDASGSLQECEMALEDTERADELSLKGIFTDDNGYFYVWCEMVRPKMQMVESSEAEVWSYVDRVYVKDGQFNTVFYKEIEDVSGTKVLNFQIGADGTPVFFVMDRKEEKEGAYIQEMDVDRQELKEAVRLDKAADSFGNINNLEHIVPIGDGLLYCQDNSLFEFHYDTQEAEKILSLTTYGIFSSDILFLGKNGDAYEIIDNHGESGGSGSIDNHGGLGNSEFITIAMGETEKEILSLGVVMTAQDLEMAVAEFNRYNKDYRVGIVDYCERAENYEEAKERLKLDVVTGKAPDIISLSGMDYRLFADKGVLADLYDFMEDDRECAKSMLIPSVAEAFEEEGHLYSIAPAFLLHSMWGYSDVTGGRSGVTFGELFQLLENSGKDLNAIWGFSADEPVLTRLCAVSMDEFIDWEKGTCSFDGEYFKDLLSFAKEYTGNYTGGTHLERIRNREIVLTVGTIAKVSDYQMQKELYGGNVSFIGYPVSEGSGTAAAFMGSAVAVNARKENRAGAWEFVKFYLLHGYDGMGFPVLKEQFDLAMENAMKDDYSNGIGVSEKIPKDFYGDGHTSISVYAATREDVDVITGLVENVKNRIAPNSMIYNIINEEAGAYFSGQSDVDKTVEIIQNRVSLLLQESR